MGTGDVYVDKDEREARNDARDRGMKVKEALDTIPESMWAKLDAELATLSSTRPPDTFTSTEFATHKGITVSVAQKTIAKLVRAGKVRKFGGGSRVYYQLVK